MSTTTKSNELRIIRVYDAPVKLVWEAWTDPAKAALWWGPRGFTLTTHSKDLRVGGHWHYTMHGPDGTDYPNKTTYYEVEEQAKLVYDHGANDEQPALFRVTVTFAEKNGKTTMDMRMALKTAEEADEMRQFIKDAGGNGTWDRLAEFVEKETSNNEIFVINRSFEAPIDLVFDMWTKPEHIANWLAPRGFDTKFMRADIKSGGSSFYLMSNDAAGIKMFGRAEYLEVEKPHRISYRQQFCDENENVSRHPMAPTWPATMLTTIQLAEEGPKQTRVTVTMQAIGENTDEEIATFTNGRAGMTMGWTGSFDKLEEYLQTL